ncbi:aromatic amino acid ammonia-lyase [Vibrio chagasii]|nr:aromatic amino acid ammonia-lyase [Vibrio chagasii]
MSLRTPVERRRRDLWRDNGLLRFMYRSSPTKPVDELPLHLTRFHGCGLGEILSHEQARAVLATRLCSLSQGVSGVTHDLLNQIVTLINQDISPRIPQEGLLVLAAT